MKLLLYSGLWISAIAAALTAAVAGALHVSLPAVLYALIAMGSFTVYNFDRLKGLPADALTKPRRGRFVRSHRHLLLLAGLVCFAGTATLGVLAGWRIAFLLLFVFLLSLVHHKAKRLPMVKPLYIALAWLCVVGGIPTLWGGLPLLGVMRDFAPVGLAVFANVLACDAADREAEAKWLGHRTAWNAALILSAAGAASALLLKGTPRLLGLIPLLLFLSLLPRRDDESYVATFVDGSLLAGALLALVLMRVA
jgi:hypothetical protein